MLNMRIICHKLCHLQHCDQVSQPQGRWTNIHVHVQHWHSIVYNHLCIMHTYPTASSCICLRQWHNLAIRGVWWWQCIISGWLLFILSSRGVPYLLDLLQWQWHLPVLLQSTPWLENRVCAQGTQWQQDLHRHQDTSTLVQSQQPQELPG